METDGGAVLNDADVGSGVNNNLNSGLTQSQIKEIVNMPKGSRPDPTTYLSKEYIDAHLAKFNEGASIIMTKEQYINYVKGNAVIGIPTDNTQFVLPQNYCDKIASEVAGDIKYYEKALGFEAGANSHWIPGGKTDGGVPEAITDLIPNTPDNVTITEIK